MSTKLQKMQSNPVNLSVVECFFVVSYIPKYFCNLFIFSIFYRILSEKCVSIKNLCIFAPVNRRELSCDAKKHLYRSTF